MRVPDTPFWTWSLAAYAREGAGEACLSLQDRQGLDVNLLLLCCWLGSRGTRLTEPGAAHAITLAAAWAQPVIMPLRAVRRHLKPLAGDDAATSDLRSAVAALELTAEKLQQTRLYKAFAALPEGTGPPLAAAGANLRLYADRAAEGETACENGALANDLANLLRAVFPGAGEADIVAALDHSAPLPRPCR